MSITIREKCEIPAFEICGIKFAPLLIPFRRRLETFSLFLYVMIGFIIGPFILPFIMIYVALFTSYWYIIVLYIVWCFYDSDTPSRGGRRCDAFREGWFANPLRDYFPAKLIKTADLPPDSNYLFCAYPHGIICFSIIANFATEDNCKKVFPGLKPFIVALNAMFKVPLSREALLAKGVCSSSEESINYLLSSKEKGTAVILMLGGAAEALLARPGVNHIILNKRKGFIRLAMKNGVPIVPVYSFGENDIFDQVKSERLERIQNRLRKYLGVVPLIVLGRGLFQYTFGLLPHRTPITTVVGKPIPVPKTDNPTVEEIDEIHAKFKRELVELFEAHKEKYDLKGRDAKLIIE